MKVVLQIAILSFFTASSTLAATGYSFLEIPVGARESALGGAGAALISGPTAAAHNPATLIFAKRGGFVMMANRHFGDTRAQFFGVNIKSNRWAFAPHYWGTRIPDIEFRTAPTREPISEFDAINSAVGFSLARKVTRDFGVGLTGHYLYSKIHVESSDGWAVDGGAFWKTPVQGLSLGMAVNHLGHVSEFIYEDIKLPTTLRGGAAYEHPLNQVGTILLTVEGAGVRDNTPTWRGGLEFRAQQFIALRAGYIEGLETQGVSLGFGLFHSGVKLDYAYIPYKDELGDGHRFSFGMDL